jgi:hypothetical protein
MIIPPATPLACLPQQGSGRLRLQLRRFRPLPLLEIGEDYDGETCSRLIWQSTVDWMGMGITHSTLGSLPWVHMVPGRAGGLPMASSRGTTSFLLIPTQLDLYPHLWGQQIHQWTTLERWTNVDDIPFVLLQEDGQHRRRAPPPSSHATRSIHPGSQRHVFQPLPL